MALIPNQVPPVLSVVAHLGRGVQRVATDAVFGRLRSLPRTIRDLDAAFLSQLMGRTVTSVSMIRGDVGTSSRARLALTGDGIPASIFVKMAAETAATRLMGEVGLLGETETRFYRELAAELGGVPRSYGSAFDPMTGRFILLLEDLAVEPCEFPDTLHPLTTAQAALTVELLARLHGNFWGRLPRRSGDGQLGWLNAASAGKFTLLTEPLLKTSLRSPRGSNRYSSCRGSVHRRQLRRGRTAHR